MTRHLYGISALVSQTSFEEKLSVASRNVSCFLGLGRMLCFIFLSNMTLKIPSSLNKPVPCSKIVGKTEREKMRQSSNHDWLVIIFYCISYMNYLFNILPSQQLVEATCFLFLIKPRVFSFIWLSSFFSKCTESHVHLKWVSANSYHPNQELKRRNKQVKVNCKLRPAFI